MLQAPTPKHDNTYAKLKALLKQAGTTSQCVRLLPANVHVLTCPVTCACSKAHNKHWQACTRRHVVLQQIDTAVNPDRNARCRTRSCSKVVMQHDRKHLATQLLR